jgi:hypothetical protein
MPRARNSKRPVETRNGSEPSRQTRDRLIALLLEFDSGHVEALPRWTLAMTAAWFVWRSYEAVRDQLKFARGDIDMIELNRKLDPPIFFRQANRQPGSVACVFEEAGLAKGTRPNLRLEDYPPPNPMTDNPYDRLKYALQVGQLRATHIYRSSIDATTMSEEDILTGDWTDFDALADPPIERWIGDDPPSTWNSYPHWSDPKADLVVVRREDALKVERVLCLREFQNPTWSISQALGWLAYCDLDEFRSLEPRDLERRQFLASEYPIDWSDPDPIGALTSALLAGKLKAHRDRHELTELEIGDIIHKGLWTHKDLWFRPEDVVDWPPRRERVPSGTETKAMKLMASGDSNISDESIGYSADDKKLDHLKRGKSRTGPKPGKREEAINEMRAEIASGRQSLESLWGLWEEGQVKFAEKFHVKSRDTAFKALNFLQNEAEALSAANSGNSGK